jgi:rhamnosyltransferase
MNQIKQKIGAIIVLYFPEWNALRELLDALESQVSKIYLISNGMSLDTEEKLRFHGKFSSIENLPSNPGLGAAINCGLKQVLNDHCEYVFLFDQDSLVPNDFVKNMLNDLAVASSNVNKVAAIGPSFYDLRSNKKTINKFKFNGKSVSVALNQKSPVKTDCLITSGMLINLKTLSPAILFDETYFVDQVDAEWCFRVTSSGYCLFGSRRIEMGHRLSDANGWHFGPITFLQYSPVRRYWYYKNSIRLIRSSFTPYLWRIRLCIILIISFLPNMLIDKNALNSMSMMFKGILAGFETKNSNRPKF